MEGRSAQERDHADHREGQREDDDELGIVAVADPDHGDAEHVADRSCERAAAAARPVVREEDAGLAVERVLQRRDAALDRGVGEGEDADPRQPDRPEHEDGSAAPLAELPDEEPGPGPCEGERRREREPDDDGAQRREADRDAWLGHAVGVAGRREEDDDGREHVDRVLLVRDRPRDQRIGERDQRDRRQHRDGRQDASRERWEEGERREPGDERDEPDGPLRPAEGVDAELLDDEQELRGDLVVVELVEQLPVRPRHEVQREEALVPRERAAREVLQEPGERAQRDDDEERARAREHAVESRRCEAGRGRGRPRGQGHLPRRLGAVANREVELGRDEAQEDREERVRRPVGQHRQRQRHHEEPEGGPGAGTRERLRTGVGGRS